MGKDSFDLNLKNEILAGKYHSESNDEKYSSDQSSMNSKLDIGFKYRLLAVMSDAYDRHQKVNKGTSEELAENNRSIIASVQRATFNAVFDYAKEGDKKPYSFPDPNTTVFTSSPISDNGDTSARVTPYKLAYFDYIRAKVDANSMSAPGHFGSWVDFLTGQDRLTQEKPEHSPVFNVILLLLAALNVLLWGPKMGLEVPTFLIDKLGNTAIYTWGYILLMALGGLGVLCLLGTDDCYEKGLFRLLCSSWAVLLLVGHFGLSVLSLLFWKRQEAALAIAATAYYLLLGLSVLVADTVRSSKHRKTHNKKKCQAEYCTYWEKNEKTILRFLELNELWWKDANGSKPLDAGLVNMRKIYEKLKQTYRQFRDAK